MHGASGGHFGAPPGPGGFDALQVPHGSFAPHVSFKSSMNTIS